MEKYVTWRHGLAGVASGVAATISLMPLDFLKIQMQAHGWWALNPGQAKTRLRFRDILTPVLRKDGVKALFSGSVAASLAAGLSWGSYLLVYESLKLAILKHKASLSSADIAASALVGGFVQTTVTHPFWMIKTRVQLQHRPSTETIELPRYHGTWNALRQIAVDEGIRGLYRGYSASVVLTSHGSIQFTSFEKLKALCQTARKRSNSSPELSYMEVSVCAALSKVFAVVGTYPIQVAKTRMQDQKNLMTSSYMGLFDTMKKMYRFEGVLGFYKGLLPSLMRNIPYSTVTLLFYEKVFVPALVPPDK